MWDLVLERALLYVGLIVVNFVINLVFFPVVLAERALGNCRVVNYSTLR